MAFKPRRISEIKSLISHLAQTSHYQVEFGSLPRQLKSYLNSEIARLKESVSAEIIESQSPTLVENFKKVKAKLDSYAKHPLNEAIVEEVFYIQDLLAEVKRNVS